MTSCEIAPILRASHIKPWRNSSVEEKRDVFNGVLLSPNMDALFDRGFISFTNEGGILRGPEISQEELVALGWNPNLKIKFTDRHIPYLEYHRKNVFDSQTSKPTKTKQAARS